MSLVDALCGMGHIASARQLAAVATKRAVASAVGQQLIQRAGRGIYVCAHVDGEQLAAARAGCLIDCVSALARHDVWSGIRPHTLHLRARPHQHVRGAAVRWSRTHGVAANGEVSPVDAILEVMRCLPPDDALACVESALYLGYLDERGLQLVYSLAPRSARRILARRDPGAQSGLETHARLRLLAAGHTVRTQVPVPGTSDLDLLVDERVGIETDGRKWHADRFIEDRTKDIIVEGAGIRMLRIASQHVFTSWPRTLATIERMLRDARS
jgi:very-short-patch-repair endonuclease